MDVNAKVATTMDVNAKVVTLPEEMIIEIVARLPVKSVGRCRCVSPRWRSLLSDPGFAKLHFQVSRKLQSLIFQYFFKKLITTASFEEESLVVQDLEAPFDHKYLQFLGSCNGMVAVLDSNPEEGLFIWNPSTGFFKKLPSRRFPNFDCEYDDIKVGFGYASCSDEYKLVMDAEIYSSKTNSWKPIEMPGFNFGIGMSVGVLCRGALHWRDYTDEHQGQLRLYAFDLEKEEFSMMKLPSSSTQWNIIYDFGVTCEGCLFSLAERQVQDCGGVVEVWVMREYGNIDSWTRSLSVKIPTHPERKDWLQVRAISVMETSAFVWTMYPGEGLKFLSTNKEENTGFNTVFSDMYKGVVYKESLCCLA